MKFKIGDLVRLNPENCLYGSQRQIGIITALLLNEEVKVQWSNQQTESTIKEYKLQRATATSQSSP